MHNLLTDPLIRTRLAGGITAAISLPEVYDAASSDGIVAFSALRPHQRHAWHAFLAQLGAIAVERAGEATPPESADDWRALLRGLTPEYSRDEPWRLIVDDLGAPAFMQCPAPTGLDEYRRRVTTPDEIDLLVSAKNHDVKRGIAISGEPEDWILGLISLQTMAGFLGAGNYGIARMNGGFSARPCLGLAPADGGPGAHLFHDMRRMLEARRSLLDTFPDYFRSQQVALVWLEPWDGAASLDLRDLDPYFIEICRRVRLRAEGRAIVAYTAGSKKARVSAKAAHGNVGDFWTPIADDAKALSLSGAGFRYDRLARLLFERKAFRLPPAMTVGTDVSRQWRVVARGIAGGQGKTEGYHERNDIVLGSKTASAFGRRSKQDPLARLSEAQLEEVAQVARALRAGVAVAASGGKVLKDVAKGDRAYANPYARRFDAEVDAVFFKALDDRFIAEDDEKRRKGRGDFARAMISAASKLLEEAIKAVPCPAVRRHRARARAWSAFHGLLRSPRSVFADQPEIFGSQEVHNVD